MERIRGASRVENRAAGLRLAAIGELFALRLSRCGENQDWAVDTTAAVAAEVAAALRISQALAGSYLHYARAMREQLPRVGALLLAGDIDLRMFQTLVFRTGLITDDDVLAGVDAKLAEAIPRWPSMTRGRLDAAVDKVVLRADRDAVRRRRETTRGREIWIASNVDGMAELGGRLIGTDALALDKRLDSLADAVCDRDPRTRAERRADALGALGAGADGLACRCGRTDCPSGAAKSVAPVLIHVVAEKASVEGTGTEPGYVMGGDGLVPPELLAELAESAAQRPLLHPADAPPEAGYVPSRALADFVRARDLTCRFPGCDRPATGCDLDHTIAHADGGATHASNLKCVCRQHHLLKTFWGWADQQLPDGTVIWIAPSGATYVTTPGSAILFPGLCAPTGPLPTQEVAAGDHCAERTAMMPTRRRSRAQNKIRRIAAERAENRSRRTAHSAGSASIGSRARPVAGDGEPPPF